MTVAKGGIVSQEDIGNVATPPFVRLPTLTSTFHRRADRCTSIAARHESLEGFLLFVSALSRAQDGAQQRLPSGTLPGRDVIFERRKRGQAALFGESWSVDPTWTAALDAILETMAKVDKPAPAEAARARLA